MRRRLLTDQLSRFKPFILLGAEGVGKSTLMKDFAGNFSNSIHLDLETPIDRKIFDDWDGITEILQAASFLKGKEIRGKGTLIVLDEIGRCRGAARWMEEYILGGQGDGRTRGQVDKGTGGQADRPFVVAVSSVFNDVVAGLQGAVDQKADSYFLYPFSFEEFLSVMDDTAALEALREVPVPEYAYRKLLNYFHLYALVGGMPEVALTYMENRHIGSLKRLYEKIQSGWEVRLSEVTAGKKSLKLSVEVLQNAYPYAATRISYNHFSNLDKGSREVGNAFRSLEKAFLLHLLPPVTSSLIPAIPDPSRAPRLHMLDTGMVNYFSGIQKPLFQSHDMNAIFEGQIARQSVGQEILATTRLDQRADSAWQRPANSPGRPLGFWIREKVQSKAEVDFVLEYRNMMIPVMVKSGEPGRLRSLHQFMDEAQHPFAIRLYADKLKVLQTNTVSGKKFFMLDLPYFLAGRIPEYLGGFIRLAQGNW